MKPTFILMASAAAAVLPACTPIIPAQQSPSEERIVMAITQEAVRGITTVKGTSGGKSFRADVRFTDTLVRQQGQWRLVVSHVTGMPTR